MENFTIEAEEQIINAIKSSDAQILDRLLYKQLIVTN